MSYNDHSQDKYIIGGVALIIIIAAIAFVIALGNSNNGSNPPASNPTSSTTSPSTGIDTGTSTVATSTPATSGSPEVPASDAVTALAKCLASKKVTMYGAYWCTHCQAQKKEFGDAFKYVPYVECTQNTQLCLSKGIQGYPTWIFPDGQRVEGEQSLAKLAQASGCPYQP